MEVTTAVTIRGMLDFEEITWAITRKMQGTTVVRHWGKRSDFRNEMAVASANARRGRPRNRRSAGCRPSPVDGPACLRDAAHQPVATRSVAPTGRATWTGSETTISAK